MGSAVDTSVKFYRNTFAGIPKLKQTRGDMVRLLDAVLVNGFGQRNIDSAVYEPGFITYNIAGNPFPEWVVVTVEGSPKPELNGEFRAVEVSSGSIKLPVKNVTAAPVSTAGMTVKFAPMGYEIYRTNGGGKRVYRSKNPLSNKTCLVVHDEAMAGYTRPALWAAVGIVQDTVGVEPEDFRGAVHPWSPTLPYVNWKPNVEPNRIGWYKWYYKMYAYESGATGSADDLTFLIVGDDRIFFYETLYMLGWYGRIRYTFGEIDAVSSADQWATILVAEEMPLGDAGLPNYPGQRCAYGGLQAGWTADATGRSLLSRHDGSLNGERYYLGWLRFDENGYPFSGVNGTQAWPNAPSGSTLIVPVFVQGASGYRGRLPGAHAVLHLAANFQDGQIVKTQINPGEPKRRFMMSRTQYNNFNDTALVAYDLTGPWRKQ